MTETGDRGIIQPSTAGGLAVKVILSNFSITGAGLSKSPSIPLFQRRVDSKYEILFIIIKILDKYG